MPLSADDEETECWDDGDADGDIDADAVAARSHFSTPAAEFGELIKDDGARSSGCGCEK